MVLEQKDLFMASWALICVAISMLAVAMGILAYLVTRRHSVKGGVANGG